MTSSFIRKSLLTEALEKIHVTPRIVELEYVPRQNNELMKINVVHRQKVNADAQEGSTYNSDRKSGSYKLVYLPKDCQFFEGSFVSNISPIKYDKS